MEHGRLIEMGQLTTIDSDGTKTEYKRALVIEFASVAEIKQAIEEGHALLDGARRGAQHQT